MTPAIRVEELTPEDRAFLGEQLHQYNVGATGVTDGRWLAVFARDDGGAIIGGLHGWTWGGIGYVDTFWIREDLRGQGLGTQLLAAAEREATERGCHVMHLSTHDYQAPGFYPRVGYERIGEMPGWPEGTRRIFFVKPLAARA